MTPLWLRWLFTAVLHTSWQASLLAVVVLVMQRIGRPWLSSRARHALWLVVVARLLVPVTWESPYSVSFGSLALNWVAPREPEVRESPVPFGTDQGSLDELPDETLAAIPVSVGRSPLSDSSGTVPSPEDLSQDLPTTRYGRSAVAADVSAGEDSNESGSRAWGFDEVWNYSPLVWLAGLCLAVLWIVRHWRRSFRAFANDQCNSNVAWREQLESCQRELGLRRNVGLRVSDQLGSPAVVGFWRPCILLPQTAEMLTSEELRLVFLHELTHIRRGDVGLNWCLAGLKAVHWFNPLLRWTLNSMQHLRELACDEAVLSKLTIAERGRYRRTVLRVVELAQSLPQRAPLVGHAGLFNHRDSLAVLDERIRMMAVTPRRSFVRNRLIPGLLLLSLGWLGFTQAQEPPAATSSAPPPAASRAEVGEVPAPVDRLNIFPNPQSATDQAAPVQPAGEAHDYPARDVNEIFAKAFGTAGDKTKSQIVQWAEGVAADNATDALNLPERTKSVRASAMWTEDRLLVRASAAGHQRLAAALERVRKHGLHQLTIETLVTQIPEAEFRKLSVHWDAAPTSLPDPDGGASIQRNGVPTGEVSAEISRTQQLTVLRQTLDETQSQMLHEELSKAGKKTPLFAPKVVVYDGQEACIVDGVIRPFIVGWRGSAQQFRLINEGWSVVLQPDIEAEGRIVLNARLKTSQITKVDLLNVPRVGGKMLTVQAPEVQVRQIHVSTKLQSGQTLAIGLPAPVSTAVQWDSVTGRPTKPEKSSLVQLVLWRVTAKQLPEEEKSGMITKVYPVAELVVPIPAAPVPGQTGDAVPRQADFKPLIDLITQTIHSESWEPQQGRGPEDKASAKLGSIQVYQPTLSLVVRHTKEVHQELEELLNQFRKLQDASITLSAQIMTVTDDQRKSLGLEDPEDSALLNSQQHQALDKKLKAIGAKVLSMPRVMIFSGQTATIQVATSTSTLDWLIGATIRERDQAVKLKVALNARQAAEALGSGWSEAIPQGSSLLIDATSRLLTAQQPDSPILQAAAQSPALLRKIQGGPGARTLIWIKPEIVRHDEQELKESKADTVAPDLNVGTEARTNVRMVYELLSDLVDPPRFYPLVGIAQVNRRHYKCTVHFQKLTRVDWPIPFSHAEDESEIVYFDVNTLIRPTDKAVNAPQQKPDVKSEPTRPKTSILGDDLSHNRLN